MSCSGAETGSFKEEDFRVIFTREENGNYFGKIVREVGGLCGWL